MAEYTINDDLRQRHIEAYFGAYDAISAGMMGDASPEAITHALLTFATGVKESGLKLTKDEFAKIADEFGVAFRVSSREKRALSASETNGAVLRAAIRAEIIDGIAEGNVADLPPWQVRDAADAVAEAVKAAYTVPKK